ncbi:MAG: hypothetical protein HRT47_07185 [Candidatus Caenarcaniphilales bacterium]|nr:hypothetical protein [Candidatus Caenarcaniphilales bacterium]
MSFSIETPDFYDKFKSNIADNQKMIETLQELEDIDIDSLDDDDRTGQSFDDLLDSYMDGTIDSIDELKASISESYNLTPEDNLENPDIDAGSSQVKQAVSGMDSAFLGSSDADVGLVQGLEARHRGGENLQADFGDALLKDAGIEDAELIDTVDLGNGMVNKTYQDESGKIYTLQESSTEFGYTSQLFYEDGSSTAMNVDSRRGEYADVTMFRYSSPDDDGNYDYTAVNNDFFFEGIMNVQQDLSTGEYSVTADYEQTSLEDGTVYEDMNFQDNTDNSWTVERIEGDERVINTVLPDSTVSEERVPIE